MHQYASYHTSVSLQLIFFSRFLNTSLFLTTELLHVSPVNKLPKMKKKKIGTQCSYTNRVLYSLEVQHVYHNISDQ